MSAVRTVAPASRAASTHELTLASWSRRVTSTSSPGRQVRPSDRLRCRVRVVMLAPKMISSGAGALRKSAIASWAFCKIASDSRLVAKAPPWLALQWDR